MTFLPVVGRELRVASRRRSTYWTRFFAALGGIAVCTWVWLTIGDGARQAQLALTLFYTLSGFAFIFSLFSGVSVTADCLSEEKREGTLGLLFLTDLKGYDVVLGKLAATSVNAFYRLVAVVPVLAIPLLLGGLTYGEFWRMVLVLINTLFFSLTAGCLLSAISRNERKAMGGTFFLILLVTAGPPLAGFLLASRQNFAAFDLNFLLPSAAYSYARAFDALFKLNADHFWWSLSITHFFGWTFLAMASVIVPFSWQDKPLGERKVRWRERWQRWQFGDAAGRSAFRTRLLEINPFFWLAGRNRLKPAYVLGVLGLGGCFWLWLFWKFHRDMLDPAAYIPTAIILHTLIKFWVASEACRPLSQDRRSGALELLLSTPLSVGEILRGQFLALRRQFGGPVVLILVADFIMFLAGMRDGFLHTSNDWMMLCLAGVVIFLADLYTLAWLGMWLGLTAKKASAASTGALVRVLAVPWVLFFVYVTATMFFNLSRFNDAENLALGAWFTIGIVADLFFFTWARTNLRHEFRVIATQRFDLKIPQRRRSSKRAEVQASGEPVQA